MNFISEEVEELRPQITVFGVGGAGGNAVNNMITSGLTGVTFAVANTDSQSLSLSKADARIQIGRTITQGLGAGARPEIGRAAAEESLHEIVQRLQGAHMCFIAAGMGGGTGTGAAPVIARAAKEMDILTVGVVTKPFQFEGTHRMNLAMRGIEELQQYVDTLIVIPNQNLFRIANEQTTFAQAFNLADQVLHAGVRGVTDLMLLPGLINLDFADVRSVMSEMGKAMMGTGEGEGEHRAINAAEAAISNPLLDDVSLKGARAVLINITGGHDMTLFDVDEATNRIRNDVDAEANIIFGAVFNDEMSGKVRVSVVATGIDSLLGSHQGQSSNKADATAAAQSFISNGIPAATATSIASPTRTNAPINNKKSSTATETISSANTIASPQHHNTTTSPTHTDSGDNINAATNARTPARTVDELVARISSTNKTLSSENNNPSTPHTGIRTTSGSLEGYHPPAVGTQSIPNNNSDTSGELNKADENNPPASDTSTPTRRSGIWDFMRANLSSRRDNEESTQNVTTNNHANGQTDAKRSGSSAAKRKEDDQFEIPSFLRRQVH